MESSSVKLGVIKQTPGSAQERPRGELNEGIAVLTEPLCHRSSSHPLKFLLCFGQELQGGAQRVPGRGPRGACPGPQDFPVQLLRNTLR